MECPAEWGVWRFFAAIRTTARVRLNFHGHRANRVVLIALTNAGAGGSLRRQLWNIAG